MNYRKLVPADSFIGQYLQYMNNQETSYDYDFWCALWLLSIACGRECIVARPRAPVFLNLYAILVAESGITRKSSAVKAAAKIATALTADDKIGMIEAKTTPERLDDTLHRRTADTGCAQVAVAISELAVFLGVEQYNSAMPALLTDLYDCPETRSGGGTLSRGAIRQELVFVSFLSASTPSWLLRSVNPNVVEGGFTSRCMFVVSDTPKKRIAWPETTPRSGDTNGPNSDNLLEILRATRHNARRYGTITLNESALKTFRTWYGKRKFAYDAFRSSFESREDAHVLRVAAFLCINDGSWVVQAAHLRLAIKFVEGIKIKAARLFQGTNTRSKFILGIEATRDALLAAGLDPIPRSKLFLKCRMHLDNAEFNALLDVMHEIGAIQRFELKQEKAGRPTDLIRGTKLLASRGITETLAEKMAR